MDYVKAFVVGGIICAIVQILMEKTKLMPGRIMVMLVCTGALLGAVGIYGPFSKWAGAGANVPLLGFGNVLWKGVKEAVLEYRISASAPDGSASLADITLHTGRTHQIRVQFASRRHPLWGDGKYGSRIKGDIALQSARLRFIHPDTGKEMDFRLPVPGTWPAWGIRQENDNGTTV